MDLFGFLIIVGIIWLQIILSKKNSEWYGLTLPFISFFYSLIIVFGRAVFEIVSGWGILWLIVTGLLIRNIPTLVLMVIYFACRDGNILKKQLVKMNIQDLD
ncbi:MAG: hypothetical protein KGZ51_01235 [Erysipelothrix sp.]|jgi:hypothetical protein|nr:hypothetical protein [Erysipelothrix sp.]